MAGKAGDGTSTQRETTGMETSQLYARLSQQDGELAGGAADVYRIAMRIWKDAGQTGMTEHGKPHIDQVIANLDVFTHQLDRIHSALQTNEMFVLLCAACVHDIGMLLGDNDARDNHAQNIHDLVMNSWHQERDTTQTHFIELPLSDRRLREAVALVARAHWTRYALELPTEGYLNSAKRGRVRLLGLLLAMADLLDLSPERAWYLRRAYRLCSLSDLSALHHHCHDRVEGCTLSAVAGDRELQFAVSWYDSPIARQFAAWRGQELDEYFSEIREELQRASEGAVVWHQPWRKDGFRNYSGVLPELNQKQRDLLAQVIDDESRRVAATAAVPLKAQNYSTMQSLLTVQELSALLLFEPKVTGRLGGSQRAFVLRSALGAWPFLDFPERTSYLAAPGWWAVADQPSDALADIVRDAIKDPASSVRASSAAILGLVGQAQDVTLLREAMNDGEFRVWANAVSAIARLSGASVRRDLEDTLRYMLRNDLRGTKLQRLPESSPLSLPDYFVDQSDDDRAITEAVVDALAICGDQRSARLLRVVLDVDPFGTGPEIAEAVLDIETRRDPSRVLLIARDAEELRDVRAAAIRRVPTLFGAPDPAMLDYLEEVASTGPDMTVMQAAAEAVIAMDLARGLGIVNGLLDRDDVSPRGAAELGAAKADWGDPDACDVVVLRCLRERLGALGGTTGEITLVGVAGDANDVGWLRGVLRSDPDYYEELAVAEAICRITRRTQGLPGLGDLLRDDDGSVASAAAQAFAQEADEETIRQRVNGTGRDVSAHVLAVLDWRLNCPEHIRSAFPPTPSRLACPHCEDHLLC